MNIKKEVESKGFTCCGIGPWDKRCIDSFKDAETERSGCEASGTPPDKGLWTKGGLGGNAWVRAADVRVD